MMSQQPIDTTLNSWHKYFAIESNNQTWQLLEHQQRTEAESLKMLDLAHTATFHWNAVGTELNKMRAKMLLAEVHAQLGFGESSLTLAAEVLSFFKNQETPDWEIAFVHTIYAHAAYVAGENMSYSELYSNAQDAVDKISEAEDKEMVLKIFNQIPKP